MKPLARGKDALIRAERVADMNHNCSNTTINGTTSKVTGLGYSMTPSLSTADRSMQQHAAAYRRNRRHRNRKQENNRRQHHEEMRNTLISILVTGIITCIVVFVTMAIAEHLNSRYGYEEAIAEHPAVVTVKSPIFLLQSPEEDGITTGKALLRGERVICTGDTYSSFPAIGRKPVVVMVKVTTKEGVSGWIAIRNLQIRASI